MNEEELLKYMSFTDDKVMFDKCFYQEVMMPCFSNSITYKNIVKELEKENQQLKEQLQQKEDIINKAKEYNNQIIKDTKEFYRPTSDLIYSGDCLIDLAEQNIKILDNKGE